MYVLAVRHAESESNAGQSADPDSPLTDAGRRQAERIAARLAAAGVVAVYSSPYRRAIQTAEPLAERLNLPIRLRGELCEAHLEPLAALDDFSLPSPDELRRRHPRVVAEPPSPPLVKGGWVESPRLSRGGPAEWRPCSKGAPSAGEQAGGANVATWPPVRESLDDVIARCRRIAAHLKAEWPEEKDVVALFGHGLPIARLIEAWLTDVPGPSFRFVIVNAAISVLRCAGGVSSLLALNDVRHLADDPRFSGVWQAGDGGRGW